MKTAKKKTMMIAVRNLQSGDYIPTAGITVKAVQHLGGMVIVDFTDNTASPPVSGNSCTEVER